MQTGTNHTVIKSFNMIQLTRMCKTHYKLAKILGKMQIEFFNFLGEDSCCFWRWWCDKL